MTYVFGALAGLVWGFLAALLNAFVTKKAMAKKSTNAIMAANFIHMLVDVAALAVVFLLRNLSWMNFAVAIAAAAAALSITTIVFTYKLAAQKED